MRLTVDFTKALGPIRAMHGVGQPPLLGMDDRLFPYLTEAHIPYSRLHDTGWLFGGHFVDIPAIFPDFSADENDPASYDFDFTDWLLTALRKAGCQPIYRLGVTIENYWRIHTYHIHPPADFHKWARICEHIIRHYNEGWAKGFHYGIRYWEIWNEPDLIDGEGNAMWTGTQEEFYRLYDISAKHLKGCFGDSIKIGGPASAGLRGVFEEYRNERTEYYLKFNFGFLDYISRHGSPLDFYSWHSYLDVEGTYKTAQYARELLTQYGYKDVEIQLNEWNNAFDPAQRGTSEACAKAAAMMLAMQNSSVTTLCYYDARVCFSMYGGLFNPITYGPFCAYYAFKAFGKLYSLGTQVSCSWDGDGLYALAAKGDAGNAIMIANPTADAVSIDCPAAAGLKVSLIDENHLLTETDLNPTCFSLGAYQTAFLWACCKIGTPG